MLDFDNRKSDKTFEITLITRDSNGKPTGKKRHFASDDAGKLWEFYNRYSGKPRKKKKPKEKVISRDEAEKILKEINSTE